MPSSTASNAPRQLPLRLPRVCVVVIGADPNEMVEKAESLVRENPFFEFRLDYLKDPAAALPRIRRFLQTHGHVIAIATCRRVVAGGVTSSPLPPSSRCRC